MQGGKCDVGDFVLFWADLGLDVLSCVRCFAVWGFFRHCFYCSRKLISDILKYLQFAAAYVLHHLYFPTKTCWVFWWKGRGKYVAFTWAHQNFLLQGRYISWNSFSTKQEEFNLAKLLTEDLPDNFVMSVLQRIFLDLSGEKLSGAWKPCPGYIVSRHLPGDGV